MRRVVAVLGALLMFVDAQRASAQTADSAPTQGGRLAFDATIGMGHGAGGAVWYDDRGMTSIAALFSRRLGASPRGHALAAIGVGTELNFSDVACLATLDGSPGGGCGSYPSPAYISTLAGWTTHGAQDRGLRLLAGPAYTDNGFGMLTRADASAPIANHVSFVWRGHILFGPRDFSQRIQIYSWGMGIRIQ